MAYMAGGGGGSYKRPKNANFGQKKRVGAKKTPQFKRFIDHERSLSQDSAQQLQKSRADYYNMKNPVKGGELKKSPTRRLTPTSKPRMGKVEGSLRKLKRDASDVWQGKKGYGKAIVDFADEGFSNYLKNKKKKPVRKAPNKKFRKDGPVVGVMKKVKKRNAEIDRWTQ